MKKQALVAGVLTLLLLTTTLPLSAITTTDQSHEMLIRIDISNQSITLPKDATIAAEKPDEYIDLFIWSDQLDQLTCNYNILINDVESYDDLARGSYRTFSQMESYLNTVASTYSSFTTLTSLGQSYEGRDVWCLEITDNPGTDEGEPGVFFMGLHHAREWPTVEITLNIIDELVTNYGSDSTITNLVDNRRIWIVPCVNPDGYYYDHDQTAGSNSWRKNRHYIDDFGTIGVDLNRNYDGSCNGDPDGSWGSVGDASVSHESDQEVYCGQAPGSELEISYIKELFIQEDIHAALTFHTHGELVLWPWAYSYGSAPDDTLLTQIGQGIASEITQQDGTGTYSPSQGSGLYPTTGDTVDWAYGYSHYILGRPTFCYTIEACNTFHPVESALDQVTQENWEGALYILQEAETIQDDVDVRVIPPTIEPVTDPGSEYTLSWTESNPDANPSIWQLDQYSGRSTHTDNAESDNDYWDLNGFTRTTERSNSGSYSYKATNANEVVASMTSNTPLYVTAGTTFSFSTWYGIETNWDYAIIEVSTNGRLFDVLDTITGSSSGWQQYSYNLNDYIGESVILRIRFTTDGATLEEGFYVDDISPLAAYQTHTTLSDTITGTSYTIQGQPTGSYYYQVRGYNTAYGWGDWSSMELVENAETNTPPATPDAPIGPNEGAVNTTLTFSAVTTDIEGDDISYLFDWGDGSDSGWIGPIASGENITADHQWTQSGTYNVTVMARDAYGESGWSNPATIEITNDLPSLEITDVSGGFLRLRATLQNSGTSEATDIDYTITFTGGLLLTTPDTNGSIDTLSIGESTTLSSGILIGWGQTQAAITATLPTQTVYENVEGTLYLIYLHLLS